MSKKYEDNQKEIHDSLIKKISENIVLLNTKDNDSTKEIVEIDKEVNEFIEYEELKKVKNDIKEMFGL